MRSDFTWLAVLLVAWLPSARLAAGAGPRALPAVRLAGRDYVPVADWAGAKGYGLHWLKRDETLELTKGTGRIILTFDSREAQINGVQVWLCCPILRHNGAACLASLDTQATLEPLLVPPKNRPGLVVRTVCLDAGHGGKDSGNRVGSNQEKIYTLLLAEELRAQLRRVGLKVTMTRGRDEFIELPNRPAVARRQGADLFVSLHFNSADTSRDSVRGAEVYCLTPASADSTNAGGEAGENGWFPGNRWNARNLCLAYEVQKSLTKRLQVEDRGVRRARFWVLRDALMPAVLVEAGFMSHPEEGKKIFTGAYRREMARAIAQGLLAYKRLVERRG
jgi:N-acetylmuramoyl-L-alanine amidase